MADWGIGKECFLFRLLKILEELPKPTTSGSTAKGVCVCVFTSCEIYPLYEVCDMPLLVQSCI